MFVNNINNKIYIGQTIEPYYVRFTQHLYASIKSLDNTYFHRAIQKYGWNNFSKYILWQSTVYKRNLENKKILKEILNKKEIEYIAKYQSNNPDLGYNLTIGGSTYKNAEYSKHWCAKPVLQYSLDKEFIKEWRCINEAQETLGFNILIKAITSGNYFWVLKTNDAEKILTYKYAKYKENCILYANNFICKPIYRFDLFGECIAIYNSAVEASKDINSVSSTTINHVAKLKENGNVLYDSIWIYAEDLKDKNLIISTIINKSRVYISKYKPIYQIFLDGNIIKLWNSYEEICEKYPTNKATINKCLNNKLNAFNNCFWIYEEDYSDIEFCKRLVNFSKTKKSLVQQALSGSLTYTEPTKFLLNTSDRKKFLKEHPTVIQFTKNKTFVKKWDTYKDIEKTTEWKFANISKCLRRTMNTAYNYIWRFENETKCIDNTYIFID